MAPSHTISPQSRPPAITGADPRTDAYRSIIAMAERNKAKPTFYREAFRELARYFNAPYAALSVHQATTVIEDNWHIGSTDPGFWKDTVQGFLTNCLADNRARIQQYNAKDAALRIALASCPVVNASGHTIGAIALVTSCKDQQQARACLAEMQGLTNLISACANLIGQSSSPNGSPSGQGFDQFDALSRAAAYSSKHEMAIAITNKLRSKFTCDQIALGTVKARRVRLLSISGFDHVPPRSPGAAKILAAMEECLDRAKLIVFQNEDHWDGQHLATDHRLHGQWSIATGGAAVASIPLTSDGRVAAILSLRRQGDQPFTREEIEKVRSLVEPLMPGVQLITRANRPLLTHAKDAAHQTAQALIRPDKPKRLAMTITAALATLWFLFGTLQYKITVPSVVVPARVQNVSAPYEATIKAAYVTAGDTVTQGQLLYELDTTPLKLEQDRLLANINVAKIEIDRALASKSVVEAKLADAQRRVFETQLQAVDQKLNQAAARAQFNGTVMRGDLRKQIGQVVAQGTPLFELAPDDDWLLELEVPDALAGDLNAGLTAQFAPHARPEQTQDYRLVRVRPLAEQRGGKNVFIAEAQPDTPIDWLRPGMEGVSKVNIGRRRVWWITLHRAINYLRLKLWL